MSNCNLHMRRCFKLLIYGSQNVSILTWIRAENLNWKIPTCSEDINKMETEFPRNGIFSPSGMHTPLHDEGTFLFPPASKLNFF